MKVQGEHFFQAPREQVWEAVLDPEVLGACLPGFQRLDAIGENEYEGALEIKVGPVQGDFQGTLELSDLQKPSSYRFKLNGMGAAGFVDGDGLLVLEESGGGTRLLYDLDAKIGGRIAGVGQRLLDSSAKVLARQALEGLERHFPEPTAVKVVTRQEADAESKAAPTPSVQEASDDKAGDGADAPPARPAPAATGRVQVAAPSQTKFAFEFAKGLAGELVPPSLRPWVWTAGLLLYSVALFFLGRACAS